MRYVDGKWLPTVTDIGIYGFFDEYRFFSNFHRSAVEVDGIVYPSSEHAYMAQKSLDPATRLMFSDPGMTCSAAKKAGQAVELRPDWEDVKVAEMRRVVYAKFSQNPDLRRKLLATSDLYLEETNYWNDRIWGVCKGEGRNELGQALMAARQRLREEA